MKKGVIISCGIIILILFLSAGYYVWGLGSKSKNSNDVTFIINAGTSKKTIAKNLANAGLIRSEIALDVYLYFAKSNIQAGEYTLSASMTPKEMINKFSTGDITIHSETITLIEGKRITDYASTLSEKLDFTKEEFLNKVNDEEFLNSLINSLEYPFLTSELLNTDIYYPLEGYLYPDTYEFLDNATPESVIKTMLNHTKLKLDEVTELINSSGLSIHQVLTMASLVEKEANSDTDREKVAQVFFKRISDNMPLGSDVTTYYGVGKEMGDVLTINDLNDRNPYNTRLTDGTMNGKLPIGPICNVSISSIKAVLNKSDTNYTYFVANTCTGEVFFQEDYQEFLSKVAELQSLCATN